MKVIWPVSLVNLAIIAGAVYLVSQGIKEAGFIFLLVLVIYFFYFVSEVDLVSFKKIQPACDHKWEQVCDPKSGETMQVCSKCRANVCYHKWEFKERQEYENEDGVKVIKYINVCRVCGKFDSSEFPLN